MNMIRFSKQDVLFGYIKFYFGNMGSYLNIQDISLESYATQDVNYLNMMFKFLLKLINDWEKKDILRLGSVQLKLNIEINTVSKKYILCILENFGKKFQLL